MPISDLIDAAHANAVASGAPAPPRRECCRDLAPPDFDRALRSAAISLARTEAGHIAAVGGAGSPFAEDGNRHYEVRPRGYAVSHEDEMLKLAGNQMGYEAVTSLCTHSLALLKTALGKS